MIDQLIKFPDESGCDELVMYEQFHWLGPDDSRPRMTLQILPRTGRT
jgi:hypothetical protein